MADPIHAALKSSARDEVLKGVAAALASPDAVVDALLSGVTVASWSSRGVHELAFPKAWHVDDARHPLQQEAFLRLAAGSSSKRAKALIQKLQKLVLLGTDRRWTWGNVTHRAIDLDQVVGLAELRHLEILNAHGVSFSQPLPQIRHLELHDTRLDALPDLPGLERLEIHGGRLPRLDVSRFPKLTFLVVQNVEELRSVDGVGGLALTTIRLAGVASPDLSGMASLKSIQLTLPAGAPLRIDGTDPTELMLTLDANDSLPAIQATSLRDLSIGGSSEVDLSALSGVASVGNLSLHDMPKLESLDGLVDFAQLNLRNLEKLVRVRGGARLKRLNLQHCPALPDLDGLGACPKLGRVDIWGCAKLTSIAGLAQAPLLTSIHTSNCTSLKSVEGLGACTELADLQFIGCRGSGLDLMPLAANTKIKRIRCTRTSIGKTRIPESLHAVVIPKSLVKSRSRASSDKPLPKQASGVARKQVAKLKKLMFTRDLDRMDQCADLVGALDSDEVATALAGGSKLERGVETAKLLPRTASGAPGIFHGTYDRFVPNRYFECGDQLMPYRGHGLRALAARVPDESPLAGLREAEGVLIVGRSKRYEKVPVRLWPLAAFEQLKRAAVYCASEIEDPELLEDCEQLEELALYDVDGVETLGAFCGPALRTLRVERLGGAWSLGSEAGLSQLEHLQVNAWWRSAWAMKDTDVRSLRGLRSLKLSGAELTEGAARLLPRLPHLTSLSLLSCRENDLSRLQGLSRLTHLEIDSYPEGGLASLPQLEGLQSLSINGVHRASLEALRQQSVSTLSLDYCGHLTDWQALEGVEHLMLRHYRWRTSKDLAELGWSGLKTVRYSGKTLPASVVNRLRKDGVDVAPLD